MDLKKGRGMNFVEGKVHSCDHHSLCSFTNLATATTISYLQCKSSFIAREVLMCTAAIMS